MLIVKIAYTSAILGLVCASADHLFVSAFNIQILGSSKTSKSKVVKQIADIIQRYDLTIVQEIRDSKGNAFKRLMSAIHDSDKSYNYFLSPRTGRTSSKEQYGFIYKISKLRKVANFEFPDDQLFGDIFERSPYIVTFENLVPGAKQSIFNTIVLHSKPRDAVAEVSALADVYDYATNITSVRDAVILGDLNADCRYITKREWPKVKLRTQTRFHWKIADSVDTTVRTTDCAYDRIITVGNMTGNSGNAGVFNFQTYYNLSYSEAKRISDHYPVEFHIY